MLTQIVSTRTMIEHGTDILLLQRSDDCQQAGEWELPGGKLEINEMPIEAAHREITQETGLDVEFINWQHINAGGYTIEFRQAHWKRFEVLGFAAIAKTGTIPRLSSEHRDARWISAADKLDPTHYKLTQATKLTVRNLGQLLRIDPTYNWSCSLAEQTI